MGNFFLGGIENVNKEVKKLEKVSVLDRPVGRLWLNRLNITTEKAKSSDSATGTPGARCEELFQRRLDIQVRRTEG
jgi:hypothetical protein